MTRLMDKAVKGFSPSSLNLYIRCPLQFYFQEMLGLSEAETVEETIEAKTMGTVIHSVFQQVYQPFAGKFIEAESLLESINETEKYLRAAFSKEYQDGDLEHPIGRWQVDIHAKVRRGVIPRPGRQKSRKSNEDTRCESPEWPSNTDFHEGSTGRDEPLEPDEGPEGAKGKHGGAREEVGPGDPDSVAPGRQEVPHLMHREDEKQGQSEGRARP